MKDFSAIIDDMRSKTLSFIVLLGFLSARTVFGMTSTNFRIDWDNVNTGGDDIGSSANYKLLDTIGDNASGTSTSANYNLSAGYRAGTDVSALSFVVQTQENSSQAAYSAFNNAAKTVTLVAAVPGSYAVGDYIVVVENKSFPQKIAIGKISSIAGNTITTDAFSGDNASMSASPSGSSNFVYRLSGSTADFGQVATTLQPTTVTMSNVLSPAATGYSVYLSADGNLRKTNTVSIAAVTDGLVSPGSEEYGISVTGTSAYGSGSDFAITVPQQVIQTRSGATPQTPDRMGVIYKLSIASSTASGLYSQSLIYTLTANY